MRKKPSTLSDQLRLAIEQSEHSRYAIHKATGVDQAVLSKFVHGERGVSLDTVDILAEYLGLRLTTNNEPTRKGGK